jgi:hypothetical protein
MAKKNLKKAAFGKDVKPDPNSYKLHKTGVFGKYKTKDISKEKFDRIYNRLSSDPNNEKLGSASSAAQQIVKEGIGERRVSVSRTNTDMVKAMEERSPSITKKDKDYKFNNPPKKKTGGAIKTKKKK